MGALSEESSGVRILAARHISTDKTPPESNAVNTTLLCHNFTLEADFNTYMTGNVCLYCLFWHSILGG